MGLRSDLRGAKEALLDSPLFSDAEKLNETFDSCTPGDESSKQKTALTRAFKELREELDYQLGKGKQDPRFPDPDDAADLQRATRTAKRATQQYLDLVEKRGAGT